MTTAAEPTRRERAAALLSDADIAGLLDTTDHGDDCATLCTRPDCRLMHHCPLCAADDDEPNTEPPCIAGDHEPDDAGTACYYCGLPAEPGDPQELAEALYCAFVNHQDRDHWSEALAGGTFARRHTIAARPNRSYPEDMPAQLAALTRWHRLDRSERQR